jgi:glycosyltransferase involved in cell wall biosynthesis
VPDATSQFPVDPAAAAAIRNRYGDGLLIGNVAALVDSHKGQLQIIEVARRLGSSHPQLHFVLVGSGSDEVLLRSAAEGLDNLHFTGQVDNVGDYLAAFDVFFYPSRHEGLGSVLLDAMANGLPIVATRVGGIPEIVEDPVNGSLCAVDDLEAQCAAILRLAQDGGLRAGIAAANREKAAGYAPSVMTARYAGLYEQLLVPNGKQRRTE